MRSSLAICLLSATALADASAPAATAQGRQRICIELSAMAPVVASATTVELTGDLRVLGSGQAGYTIQRSQIEITDEKGQVVHVADRPFLHGHMPSELTLGFTSNGGPSLPELPAGRYRARWTVDGVDSPPLWFTVGGADPPPLTVEPIARGCDPGPSLRIHLHNVDPPVHPPRAGQSNSTSIDLPSEFAQSKMEVDGVRYHRHTTLWGGPSLLSPGRWWSTVVRFADYDVPREKGTHRVIFEMAGRRSPPVDVTE